LKDSVGQLCRSEIKKCSQLEQGYNSCPHREIPKYGTYFPASTAWPSRSKFFFMRFKFLINRSFLVNCHDISLSINH
jgi:hypothetical protein